MAVYTITTLDELQEMQSHRDDDCVLANNIDASETRTWNYSDGEYHGFQPIGTAVNPYSGSLELPFTGSFDGGGFTISNLYINRTGQHDYYQSFLGHVEQIANKIDNGTFVTDPAVGGEWTLGTGWTYNAGTNKVDKNGDGTGTLTQASGDMNTPLAVGQSYRLYFSISNRSVGTVTASCGGVTLSTADIDGTYTDDFTATSTAALTFTPTDTSRFSIDNVILYRITEIKDINILNAEISGTYRTGILASDITGMTANVTGSGTGDFDTLTVSGVKVSGSVTDTYYGTGSGGIGGIAATLVKCTVTDCQSDVNISAVASSAGGFCYSAGSDTNHAVISNCSATGSIVFTRSTSTSAFHLGGFTANGGLCTECSASVGILQIATARVTPTSPDTIGGFSAYPYYGYRCISYSNIVIVPEERAMVGGFAGYISEDALSVTECASVGSITFSNPYSGTTNYYSYIGGFAGQNYQTDIRDCYTFTDICKTGLSVDTTGNGTLYIGGFIGSAAASSSIGRCFAANYVPIVATGIQGGFYGKTASLSASFTAFWDTEVSGLSNAIGTDGGGTHDEAAQLLGKTTAEMKVQDTYITTNLNGNQYFDFDTVWEITTFEQGALAPTNLTVWLSQVDDYDSFEEGTNDAEAFTVIVPSTNEIRWVQSLESLLVGTSGDEWRVGSNKLETAITPTNYKVEQQTEYGSSRVQPIKINASLIYVDYVGRKLREMSFTGDKYESLDLTVLSEDITVGGITTIARQKNPDSIIWCTLETGELISFTYDRSQNVLAWSEHPLGGTDVEVQSVSVSPSTTEDEVYLTVQRTVNSATVIYWEKLAPRIFDTIDDAYFVDCGITFDTATSKAISAFADYSSTVTGATKVTSAAHTLTTGQQVIIDGTTNYDGTYTATVINTTEIYIMKAYVANDATGSLYIPVTAITGLTHLEGETVQVLGDGVVLDEEVVASGAITASTAILKAQVGLPYTWKVSPMRLVVSGEDGTSFGSHIRVSEMVVSFLNTGDADFYTTNSTETLAINFSDERWTNEELITGLFTGDVVVSMPGGHSAQTPIVITGSEPLPATVRCIIARAEQTGR